MADQSKRMRALCTLVINGEDITRSIDPYLLSVQTQANIGDAYRGDTCSIELDDREGRLAIPPPDADLEVWLGWMNETLGLAWVGRVKEVESGFSRRGGARRLWIEAMGFEGKSLVRTPFRAAWGDGEGREISLEEVLTQAGNAAGLSVRVSPSMRNIKRKYWAQQNESFSNFGARLAEELGGNFKISNHVATMVNPTDGQNVEGQQLNTIDAVWGENLISWQIKPFSAMPEAGSVRSVVYNREQGKWESSDKDIQSDLPFGLSAQKFSRPGPAPNAQTAAQWNVGMEGMSLANRGVGQCTINGEPMAIPFGHVNIKGARAGVDGLYMISEVQHSYSRTAGFITNLTMKFPLSDPANVARLRQWDWPAAASPGSPQAWLESYTRLILGHS